MRLIFIAAIAAVAVARPETYKENEDFQYSRSSSDDGSKSGHYGAQRGNMGGNYERAHNMDSLAQNQLSGLVSQVQGELGDGAKTRTGSVYTAANSRGIYGSGNYDLSNLKGRNFQEGYRSQSYLTSNANGNSQLQNTRYNGYQSEASNLADQHSLHGAQNVHESNQYRSEAQTGFSSGQHSQSSFHQQNMYDQSNLNSRYSNGAAGSDVRTRFIVNGQPVTAIIRPGSTIIVPVATQTYDNTHAASVHAGNSETEFLNTNDRQLTYRPSNEPKHYETSYRYRKEWEKHDTKPVVVNPYPVNSELYEDAQVQLAGSSSDSHRDTKNAYGAYSSNSATTSSRYNSNTNHQAASSDSSASFASGLSSNGYGVQSANQQAALGNQLADSGSKPKSYQSSYSYHKSWERQGDPYTIYPATGTSQRLTSTSNSYNTHYGSQQNHLNTGVDCDENGHVRQARSVDYGQQTQQINEHLGQQSQQLEDLGQQAQTGWDKFSDGQQVQNKFDRLEDLGQQSQNKFDNLEDLGQQTQTQWSHQDIGQQTQPAWDKFSVQQSQTDLGQQTQAFENSPGDRQTYSNQHQTNTWKAFFNVNEFISQEQAQSSAARLNSHRYINSGHENLPETNIYQQHTTTWNHHQEKNKTRGQNNNFSGVESQTNTDRLDNIDISPNKNTTPVNNITVNTDLHQDRVPSPYEGRGDVEPDDENSKAQDIGRGDIGPEEAALSHTLSSYLTNIHQSVSNKHTTLQNIDPSLTVLGLSEQRALSNKQSTSTTIGNHNTSTQELGNSGKQDVNIEQQNKASPNFDNLFPFFNQQNHSENAEHNNKKHEMLTLDQIFENIHHQYSEQQNTRHKLVNFGQETANFEHQNMGQEVESFEHHQENVEKHNIGQESLNLGTHNQNFEQHNLGQELQSYDLHEKNVEQQNTEQELVNFGQQNENVEQQQEQALHNFDNLYSSFNQQNHNENAEHNINSQQKLTLDHIFKNIHRQNAVDENPGQESVNFSHENVNFEQQNMGQENFVQHNIGQESLNLGTQNQNFKPHNLGQELKSFDLHNKNVEQQNTEQQLVNFGLQNENVEQQEQALHNFDNLYSSFNQQNHSENINNQQELTLDNIFKNIHHQKAVHENPGQESVNFGNENINFEQQNMGQELESFEHHQQNFEQHNIGQESLKLGTQNQNFKQHNLGQELQSFNLHDKNVEQQNTEQELINLGQQNEKVEQQEQALHNFDKLYSSFNKQNYSENINNQQELTLDNIYKNIHHQKAVHENPGQESVNFGNENVYFEQQNMGQELESFEHHQENVEQHNIGQESLNLGTLNQNFKQHNLGQELQSFNLHVKNFEQQNTEQELINFGQQNKNVEQQQEQALHNFDNLYSSFNQQNRNENAKHNINNQHELTLDHIFKNIDQQNAEDQNLGQESVNFGHENVNFEQQNMGQENIENHNIEQPFKLGTQNQNFEHNLGQELQSFDLYNDKNKNQEHFNNDNIEQEVQSIYLHNENLVQQNPINTLITTAHIDDKKPKSAVLEHSADYHKRLQAHIPPEPTTEKPGFWKSVGNKITGAKDKVASWFRS